MPKTASTLFINALKLHVHLGWPDKERQKKQVVWLDVAISFPRAPKACVTNHIDDTLCYATLVEVIRKKISTNKFRLIEHLTAEIYKIVKAELRQKASITVSITKFPKIKDLSGGVSFHYGDPA